ncbi:MAG: hypothetical protein ACLFS5_13570, partial [Spirochaetaceae bacterium]
FGHFPAGVTVGGSHKNKSGSFCLVFYHVLLIVYGQPRTAVQRRESAAATRRDGGRAFSILLLRGRDRHF